MNNFVIRALAQQLGDAVRRLPSDGGHLGRRVVAQPAGEFAAAGVDKRHDVALDEIAFDASDAHR